MKLGILAAILVVSIAGFAAATAYTGGEAIEVTQSETGDLLSTYGTSSYSYGIGASAAGGTVSGAVSPDLYSTASPAITGYIAASAANTVTPGGGDYVEVRTLSDDEDEEAGDTPEPDDDQPHPDDLQPDIEVLDPVVDEDMEVEVRVSEEIAEEADIIGITYEEDGVLVVAGVEDIDSSTYEYTVALEDSGGFPGEHRAQAISFSGGEIEPGQDENQIERQVHDVERHAVIYTNLTEPEEDEQEPDEDEGEGDGTDDTDVDDGVEDDGPSGADDEAEENDVDDQHEEDEVEDDEDRYGDETVGDPRDEEPEWETDDDAETENDTEPMEPAVRFERTALGEDGRETEVSVSGEPEDNVDHLVLTYEGGTEEIVAAVKQVEEPSDHVIELEDTGGFPGVHTVYLASVSGGEIEPGDTRESMDLHFIEMETHASAEANLTEEAEADEEEVDEVDADDDAEGEVDANEDGVEDLEDTVSNETDVDEEAGGDITDDLSVDEEQEADMDDDEPGDEEEGMPGFTVLLTLMALAFATAIKSSLGRTI